MDVGFGFGCIVFKLLVWFFTPFACLLNFARDSIRNIGFGGVVFMLIFWSLVPFARLFFYLRTVMRGTHPMTGERMPRFYLAFPFRP